MSTTCVNCGTGMDSENLVCDACHQRIKEGKVFVGNPNTVFAINKRPIKSIIMTFDSMAEDGKYWRELVGESSQ